MIQNELTCLNHRVVGFMTKKGLIKCYSLAKMMKGGSPGS